MFCCVQTVGGDVDSQYTQVGPMLQFDPADVYAPHSGTYQLIVGAPDSNFTFSQTVPAASNGVYNFSYWIWYISNDTSNFVAIAQFGSNGPSVTLWADVNATATADWVFHSLLVTAPSTGVDVMTLTMYAYDPTDFILLDDISLARQTASTVLAALPSSSTGGSSSSSSAALRGVVSSSSGTVSSVRGDPQFVGLLGQSFQVHGMDQQVYNLIHDNTGLLVNALFVFLTSGSCPSTAAIKTACWSHPGSYLGTVGVMSAAGRKLSVASGSAKLGFSAVTVDGAAVAVGASVSVDDITVTYSSTHELTLTSGNYQLTLQNSDSFINVAALAVSEWKQLRAQQAHGLLGQTWRRAAKQGQQVKEIDGEVDDYAEASNELFGNNFALWQARKLGE